MVESDSIRVAIVDDHAVTRTGLRYFIKGFDDLELVGEAGRGSDALELCLQTQPDVILIDMVMPEMDGAETIQELRQQCPEVQCIALTSFHEGTLVERALQAGAIGYLLKNVSADDLADAIRAAYAGRSTLSREATEALIEATRQRGQTNFDLSEREREVLRLLCDGLSNPEIAAQLQITLATVKFHVRNILSKLGAANRAEAVSLAWKYDLVEESPPA